MKIKKLILLGISLLVLFGTTVNAYKEGTIQEEGENITQSVVANISEQDEVIELLNKNITINGDTYKVITIEKTKNEGPKKIVSEQKKEILQTNNQEYIKEYFGDTFFYEDEEYEGNIPLTHININEIDKGQYQELREKRLEFDNYSKNDLNNIKKEIKEGNITYYLINVDWEIDQTEIIDNQEVPKSYKGTMLYQTVITINNPKEYEITVTYNGQVTNKTEEYTYKAIYQKVENTIIEATEENQYSYIVPTIIISGLGIGIIVLYFLVFNKNIKIYNKTSSGFKLLGSYRLIASKNNNIDLSRYNHKIESNIYSLKLKKNIYEKLKGQTINIKIKNITKQITINERFIEFII